MSDSLSWYIVVTHVVSIMSDSLSWDIVTHVLEALLVLYSAGTRQTYQHVVMTRLGVALHVHCGDGWPDWVSRCTCTVLSGYPVAAIAPGAVHTRACSSWSHCWLKWRALQLFRLLSKYVLLQQPAAHSCEWVGGKNCLFVCFVFQSWSLLTSWTSLLYFPETPDSRIRNDTLKRLTTGLFGSDERDVSYFRGKWWRCRFSHRLCFVIGADLKVHSLYKTAVHGEPNQWNVTGRSH